MEGTSNEQPSAVGDHPCLCGQEGGGGGACAPLGGEAVPLTFGKRSTHSKSLTVVFERRTINTFSPEPIWVKVAQKTKGIKTEQNKAKKGSI